METKTTENKKTDKNPSDVEKLDAIVLPGFDANNKWIGKKHRKGGYLRGMVL
jgi:hypothetical protein